MNWFKKLFTNKIARVVVILVLLAAGYFAYKNLRRNEEPVRYATAEVVKGAFIASVSGTGQVDVSNQIDVKPEVSGKLTAVYVKETQDVKQGALLASIDSRDAQRAVSDAEISLDNAKIKLQELLASPDVVVLLSAQNAVAQAERDLEKAEENYENIEADAESALASAYEDGYSDVSTTFFRLSSYMEDLQDVLGTEKSPEEYIGYYKLILGEDSPFIKRLFDDYEQAHVLYDENFTFFRKVFRDNDRDTVYKLIKDTLETTKVISQSLESARHMYDAIVVRSYTQYLISSTIDNMRPRIESDLSSVFSNITSLEQTIDTIDDTVRDTPGKIKDSKLALESAKENLENKRLALEEIRAGTDQLDIRTQRNVVAQNEEALMEAKEKLAAHSIRAPFDGIVAEVNVKTGDSVSSGTILATLITKQQVAEISLNEVDVAKVKLGQKATLTFDALENFELTGQVIEIDSIGVVSQGVVSYNVKIGFDTQDERIKPGMSVSAVIINEVKPEVLLVPNSAVKTQGQQGSYVEVLENNQPQIRPVEVGQANDTLTEVSGNIQEGEPVITQTITNTNNNQQQQQQQRVEGGFLPLGGGFR